MKYNKLKIMMFKHYLLQKKNLNLKELKRMKIQLNLW